MYKYLAVFSSLLLLLTLARPVQAAPDLILTDAQIESIRVSCQTTKNRLKQLHDSDAVLRYNIGQRYENIVRRLMAPLNSRIALNGLDGVAMVQTTVDYGDEYKAFSKSYIDYESSLKHTYNTIDCREEPVRFYTKIEEIRDKRLVVAGHVKELYKLGIQYRTQLDKFAKNLSSTESTR